MNRTILALDIGSVKVAAVIANVKDGVPHVIGMGVFSFGLTNNVGVTGGLITNIEITAKAIQSAVNDAKRMAGVDNLNSAILSVSGVYTQGSSSTGVLNVISKEIGIKEISQAIDNSVYNASIPHDFEIIHVLPFKFRLDDQDEIDNPKGMMGNRLEVSTYIVSAPKVKLENLRRVVKLAGLNIENLVLSSYASSLSVLSLDEKALGAVCIDIGGSTSEIMVHNGNAMCYNSRMGFGSKNITKDIALGISTKVQAAEEIKLKYGKIILDTNEVDERRIEIPDVGNDDATHFVQLSVVNNLILERVLEMFNVLSEVLQRSGYKDRVASIVLTGGMTNIDGIKEFAKAFFQGFSIRIAVPEEMPGLFQELRNPAYSTVLGLILYGAGHFTNYERNSSGKICCHEFKNEDDFSSQEKVIQNDFNRDFQNIMDTDLSNLKNELLNTGNSQNLSNNKAESKPSLIKRLSNKFSDVAKKLF